MKIKCIAALFAALLVSISVQADDSEATMLRALSAWTNQSGSTLYIDTVSNDGLLTGTYINRASGWGCQNISYPVTGWIYGTAITFTVNWESSTESCSSITAWTGFYYNSEITTLWQLVVDGSTNSSQIYQGSDVFKPSAVLVNESLVLEE